jgi:hypothetical protein
MTLRTPPAPRYALILHPGDPERRGPGHAPLVAALAGLAFLGERLDCEGGDRFLPGERFLDLIAFLGCSPFVNLAPPEGLEACEALDRFCHIQVRETGDRLLFRRARHAPPPRCPSCRAPAQGWEALATADAAPWRCPACGRLAAAHELDWRQAAGIGRLFVEVWGVHPGEAVPGEEVLGTLERTTDCPWRWFYHQT